MSNTPHTLGEEFPGQLEKIHALKAADSRFTRLLEEYDDVNDKIHRSESKIEPVSPDHEVDLRKRRLAIKDAIDLALSSN